MIAPTSVSSRFNARPTTKPKSADRKSTRLNSSHLVISYAVFCLKKKQIFRVPETPTPVPSTQPSRALSTGTRALSLADASRIAGFVVQAPIALGDPDAIYVDPSPARVTLVYSSRAGIPAAAQIGVSALVVEIRGAVDQQLMGKAIGPGTTLESGDVPGPPCLLPARV